MIPALGYSRNEAHGIEQNQCAQFWVTVPTLWQDQLLDIEQSQCAYIWVTVPRL
jgi:hypothetical protein